MTNNDNDSSENSAIQEDLYYCRSLSQLTAVAEQFIIDDLKLDQQTLLTSKLNNSSSNNNNNTKSRSNQRDLKYYLNQCIHILSNYKDQCKLLKEKYNIILSKENSNDLNNIFIHLSKDIWIILETSYIYYKIIHIIILNKIPNLKEFINIKIGVINNNVKYNNNNHNNSNSNSASYIRKDRDLLEIYNELLKTLLNDQNILQIKWLLKKNNSFHNNHPQILQDSNASNLPNTGSTISSDYLLNTLLKNNNPKDFLFIDVRPRIKYNIGHIDMPNILCLEPVSFKDIYSDYELENKSMVTSDQLEIDRFNNRNNFKFIILYSDDQSFKNQNILLNILLNKSFEKPFDSNLTKIYVLENGISNWVKLGGKIVKDSNDSNMTLNKDDTSRNDNPIDEHDSNCTHSVYLNGDTSGLNLKYLPKMTPSVSHSMDQTMRDMMSSNTIFSSSVPTLGMSPPPSTTISYPFITNNHSKVSNLNNSYTLMSKQTSGPNSTINSSSANNYNHNYPKRSSSLKRFSALLPSFKNSSSTSSSSNSFSSPPLQEQQSWSLPYSSSYIRKDSPGLPQLYSTPTSTVSLSSSPSLLSQNVSHNDNNTYTTYPDTCNLLQHTNLRKTASNEPESTVTSFPQLPKLPQKVMSTTQTFIGSTSSSLNLDMSSHKDSYSSSPSLYPSHLVSNYRTERGPFTSPSNDSANSSILARKLQTETLYNPYNLDFIVGLENMGNSCYLNCIIQCLLGTHELTKIFLNNSYEKHINLKSKLGSKGVVAKNFARLVNTMYNHATASNDLIPLKQFTTDNRNSSFDEKINRQDNNNVTNVNRTSMLSSTLFTKKKENNYKTTPVRPQQFKIACGSVNSLFKDCSQQDCQEFCQFLLDGLHEDLNQNGGNPPLKELSKEAEEVREKLSLRIASSIEWERYLTTNFSVILDLFQGQYASRLQCKVCNKTSTTYQPFSVLSIPMPHDKLNSNCSIIDCFNEFTKVENLEVDEQWSCPTCKKKQPSTKKLTITRLPKNLIIHLKRFDNKLNKNNNMITYPFKLDLTEFWANDFDGRLPVGVTNEIPTRGQVPPFNYKLYGVACHFGSLYGGHYTAYVDKGIGKGWYYFDDTNYRTIKNPNEPITSNAYVLFYKRIYGDI